MGVFDDILARSVPDEGDRKTLAELSAKYGLSATVEDWDQKLGAWENWKKEYTVTDPDNPRAVFTKAEVALRTRNQELEDRVRQMETVGMGDMDFDQVINKLKQDKVWQADIAAIANPLKEGVDNIKKEMDQKYRNMEEFYWRTQNLPVKHYKEFNEELDSQKFREFYVKGTEADPNKAHDLFVAEKRAARQAEEATKREAEYQEKLKAAEAEGVKKGILQAQMSAPSQGMPVDQGGPDGMGHFQMMQDAKLRGEKPPEDVDPAPGKTLGQGLARDGLKWIYDQRKQQMVQ
jgi:hypothetical protein